jgi:hypothetical protein
MNCKEQRSVEARENYRRNKRSWLCRFGPVAVMDAPTEVHIKALLMEWL